MEFAILRTRKAGKSAKKVAWLNGWMVSISEAEYQLLQRKGFLHCKSFGGPGMCFQVDGLRIVYISVAFYDGLGVFARSREDIWPVRVAQIKVAR
jgi:hypothetical protein